MPCSEHAARISDRYWAERAGRRREQAEAHERAFRACVEALEDAPCTCYFTYSGGGEERVQCKRCAALALVRAAEVNDA